MILILISILTNITSASPTAIDIISSAAKQVVVPEKLLIAICWVEGSHNLALEYVEDHGSLSYGLCQVKLETARFMDEVFKHKYPATPERLQNPYVNAFYSAKYLKYQLKRYNGDLYKAISAYNRGNSAGNPSETQYVKNVLSAMKSN